MVRGQSGQGVSCGRVLRRFGKYLNLGNRPGALAASGSHTVAAGVASADDNHLFVVCRYQFVTGRTYSPVHQTILGRQIIHREKNIFIAPAGHHQISGLSGSHSQTHTVKHFLQIVRRDINAGIYARLELNAFLFKLFQPPVNNPFFKFEIGNTITQQPARLFVFSKTTPYVPGPGKLLSRCQSGRAGTNDGDPLAGFLRGY